METQLAPMGQALSIPRPAVTVISDSEIPPIRLEIFTSVPPWAIVHAAKDKRNAPLIREGEVAVVEADGYGGLIPEHGGLYLIEYVSEPTVAGYGRTRRTREIVQTVKGKHGWWARPYRPDGGNGIVVMSDGPYSDECHLAEKIVGRVIGIYAPHLAETTQ